jgi:hypothetical protein
LTVTVRPPTHQKKRRMQLPQTQISFSQKGLTVAIGDRQVLLGRRSRMAMAVAFTLLVHVLLLLALSANRTKDMDISLTYDNPVDTELDRPEPIPQDIPPPPLRRLRQEPMTASPAPQSQVEPAPSPQPSTSPQPMQAQTEPVPQPAPQVKIAPRQVDNVQAVKTPSAKAMPQPQTALQDSPANVPTVSDEPAPAPMKVKKKEDEQALDAKRQMAAVSAPSDLNLHDTPVPSVDSIPVPPSGLTANPSSRLAAGGGTPSAGSAGAAGGGQGAAGLKGRGSVTQALQNHDDCVTRQADGKPIPANCHMKDYASMQSTGPRPDADFQSAAAKRDARLKYKTDPGNYDYWKRVGHAPSSYHQTDDHPTPGAYGNARDQRVMTGNVNSNIGH